MDFGGEGREGVFVYGGRSTVGDGYREVRLGRGEGREREG